MTDAESLLVGYVVDEDDRRLDGLRVEAWDFDTPTGGLMGWAVTDFEGTFVVEIRDQPKSVQFRVFRGTHLIHDTRREGPHPRRSGSTHAVRVPKLGDQNAPRPPDQLQIVGRLTDATGRPAAHFLVQALGPDGRAIAHDTTRPGGLFTFGVERAGETDSEVKIQVLDRRRRTVATRSVTLGDDLVATVSLSLPPGVENRIPSPTINSLSSAGVHVSATLDLRSPTSTDPAFQLLDTRSQALTTQRTSYRTQLDTPGQVDLLIQSVLGVPVSTLDTLAAQRAAGTDISASLGALWLNAAGFDRLLVLHQVTGAGGVPSPFELDDIADILVGASKLQQFASWRTGDHRGAVLEEMGFKPHQVNAIRGVVIAGRDEAHEAVHLWNFKRSKYGDISFYTYDDLLRMIFGLAESVAGAEPFVGRV